MAIPISVDTYKAEVAERALELGAEIINDPSGLTLEPQLARVVSNHDAGLVLNHMRGRPETWAKLAPMPRPHGHHRARSGCRRQPRARRGHRPIAHGDRPGPRLRQAQGAERRSSSAGCTNWRRWICRSWPGLRANISWPIETRRRPASPPPPRWRPASWAAPTSCACTTCARCARPRIGGRDPAPEHSRRLVRGSARFGAATVRSGMPRLPHLPLRPMPEARRLVQNPKLHHHGRAIM